jgi:hypothetical protein
MKLSIVISTSVLALILAVPAHSQPPTATVDANIINQPIDANIVNTPGVNILTDSTSCPKLPYQFHSFSSSGSGQTAVTFPAPPKDYLYVIENVSGIMFVDDDQEVTRFHIRTSLFENVAYHYFPAHSQGILDGTPSHASFVAGQQTRLYATSEAGIEARAERNESSGNSFDMEVSISGYFINLSNDNCTGVGLGK